MTKTGIFRLVEITGAVLLAAILFWATNADMVVAGWLRGEKVQHYRLGFALIVWLIAIVIFASQKRGIGHRILLGSLGGYLASALSQFVVVPLLEDRPVMAPIYESVARSGILPMLFAPLATLGWVAGALALLLASGADVLRRKVLHQFA